MSGGKLELAVFGGVFDEEFKGSSIQLFEQVKREKVICLFSQLINDELIGAPDRVKSFLKTLDPEYSEKLEVLPAVEILAKRYAGYNSVNLKLGYREIEIVSPKQLIDYEKEIEFHKKRI